MCSVNCGSRCALRMHVRDDEVYWVETDHTGTPATTNMAIIRCAPACAAAPFAAV